MMRSLGWAANQADCRDVRSAADVSRVTPYTVPGKSSDSWDLPDLLMLGRREYPHRIAARKRYGCGF